MILHDLPVPAPVHSPALVRFVAAGLLATVESFLGGGLPLPRLARELAARTDTLAGLRPPARTLTRLRWLHREVSRLDAALRDAGHTEPDPHERAQLDATLGALRDALVTLLPPGPLDPTGAGRPAQPLAAVTATGTGVAIGDRAAAAMAVLPTHGHAVFGRPGVVAAAGQRPSTAWPWPPTGTGRRDSNDRPTGDRASGAIACCGA